MTFSGWSWVSWSFTVVVNLIEKCHQKNSHSYSWWFRNPANQLRLVVYPIFPGFGIHPPGGAGFQPSTVYLISPHMFFLAFTVSSFSVFIFLFFDLRESIFSPANWIKTSTTNNRGGCGYSSNTSSEGSRDGRARGAPVGWWIVDVILLDGWRKSGKKNLTCMKPCK